MVASIYQSRVKDFATFKKALDSTEKARTSSGAVLDHIYRDTADPNKLVVIQKWPSVEKARKYYDSEIFKEAIARGGVEGKSTLSFFEDA